MIWDTDKNGISGLGFGVTSEKAAFELSLWFWEKIEGDNSGLGFGVNELNESRLESAVAICAPKTWNSVSSFSDGVSGIIISSQLE